LLNLDEVEVEKKENEWIFTFEAKTFKVKHEVLGEKPDCANLKLLVNDEVVKQKEIPLTKKSYEGE
jgi:hypothetical protein